MDVITPQELGGTADDVGDAAMSRARIRKRIGGVAPPHVDLLRREAQERPSERAGTPAASVRNQFHAHDSDAVS